jgi:hypothetical protein
MSTDVIEAESVEGGAQVSASSYMMEVAQLLYQVGLTDGSMSKEEKDTAATRLFHIIDKYGN